MSGIHPQRSFIASAAEDLVEHRRAVADQIDRYGGVPVRMETFGAKLDDSVEVCRRLAASADALVVLLGTGTGGYPRGIGAETENEASRGSRWRRRFAPRQPGVDPQDVLNRLAHLQAFKAFLSQRPCGTFRDPVHLSSSVSTDLGKWLLEKVTRQREAAPSRPDVGISAQATVGRLKAGHYVKSRNVLHKPSRRSGAVLASPGGVTVRLGLGDSPDAEPAPSHLVLRNRVRRKHDRRRTRRGDNAYGGQERRRGDRRRSWAQHLVLMVMGLAGPSYGGGTLLTHGGGALLTALPAVERLVTAVPIPIVTTSIVAFTAIPAHKAYSSLIAEAEAKYGVDGALIRSVMQAESSFNALAVSKVGAQGLMQLMPEVASDYGVKDPFDPRENIMAGARYLRRLLDLHHGQLPLALASYNAGPGNVEKYGGIPPFRETRDYVAKVTRLFERSR